MVKKGFQTTIICLLLFMSSGCKHETKELDEYVFSVQLVNDSDKIQEYLEYHEEVWPEVEEGFKKAGYHSIEMYRYNNYLTMVVKVPKGSDLMKIGAAKELNTERVKTWNSLMSTYQRGLPGTPKGTTWVPMHKFYEFDKSK